MTLLDDGNDLKTIADKLSDLYIINRCRYLKLNNDGKYGTNQWIKNTDNYHDSSVPLQDWHLKAHLRKKYTVGVFANAKHNITKFLCFDVDVTDTFLSRKVVIRIIKALKEIGIQKENIHVSWSGNKGYHVEIFFSKPLKNDKAEKLFAIVLNRAGLMNLDFGKVELLPTNTQGVKLPLGINFRGKDMLNRLCFFVDYENDFKYIRSYDYISGIKKIDISLIYEIVNKNQSYYDDYLFKTALNLLPKRKKTGSVLSASDDASENGSSINYMKSELSELLKLEEEGLKAPETRNSATVALATLFKCYYGFNKEECSSRLIAWQNWQDERYYKTPLDKCIEEIGRVVNCVYANNYQLSGSNYNISIGKEEFEKVLSVKSKSGKLLMFAILLHCKIFASSTGTFFMSFHQMEKYTGFSKNTCINHLNKLVDNNYVKAVSRNKFFPDGKSKKANYYRVLIAKEKDEPLLEYSCSEIDHIETKRAFWECLIMTDDEVIRRNFNKKDYSHYRNGKYFNRRNKSVIPNLITSTLSYLSIIFGGLAVYK